MGRNLVDVTGNKNLIQGEKKLERSHFRVQVSSQEFCFILLFSFLSDYPFRLFVSELLSCSCKYKGEKGGSLRKVFCGVTAGERVGRNLRRKFHRSYLNFCSSLPCVALEREKFLRDNFHPMSKSFQTFFASPFGTILHFKLSQLLFFSVPY